MALLEVEAVSKSYPSSSGVALVVDRVSFTIARGQTLGVVGESGSGKSTVARMVLGLIEPTAGEVRFDGAVVARARGARLRWMRRRMQPVFQDPYAALNPRMRVEQILTSPSASTPRWRGARLTCRAGARRNASVSPSC